MTNAALDYAIQSHEQWVSNFSASTYLALVSADKRVVVSGPSECSFGKWLATAEAKATLVADLYNSVDDMHKHIHLFASAIARVVATESAEHIVHKLGELELASEHLKELLNKARKHTES